MLSNSTFERKLATAAHHFLYVLMVAMPLTGVLMTLYSKYGLKWFGLDVFGGLDNADLRDIFKDSHELFATILLVVIALHIGGALKHYFIDKDKTLSRMTLK
jgi:cytochrome b561